MKRRFWIGGVLLLMIFTGMTGCGGPKEPPPEHMLDGPDMMYTPEDQTPYAGTWQSRDGTIVMKVERGGGAESESDMSLSVNGEPEFEAKMWVYSTGQVELFARKGEGYDLRNVLQFALQHERKRLLRLSYRQHGDDLADEGRHGMQRKDVIYTERSEQPEQSARVWVCPDCKTENEGNFCTECGGVRPAACGKCGWQPTDGRPSVYCPECGSRLK